MVNGSFLSKFVNTHVVFKPCRISNHSPAVLKIPMERNKDPKPLKFSNFIVHKLKFENIVKGIWNHNIEGHSMYKLTQKLKFLKKPLRNLAWEKGDLHDRVNYTRNELDSIQNHVDTNPRKLEFHNELNGWNRAYNEACLEEKRFLKQHAKRRIFFHQTIKGRIKKSNIVCVRRLDNQVVEGLEVPRAFIDHNTQFLGTSYPVTRISNHASLFSKKLSHAIACYKVRKVTNDEVKNTIFAMWEMIRRLA